MQGKSESNGKPEDKNAAWAMAVSPTPECLCLAAGCGAARQKLFPAGARLIADVLRAWSADAGIDSGVVIVPDVSEPDAVRGILEALGARGMRVLWVAPGASASVARACRGVQGVTLVTGRTMREAFFAAFAESGPARNLLRELDRPNADLIDYLKYKISLLLIKGFSPEPLEQAVAVLAAHSGPGFSLGDLHAADAESVANFRDNDFPYFEGKSPALRTLKERIIQVAPTDMSVLIIGETGTGKESVAYYLHEFSARRGRPFVSLNCAGLNETFLRSELFGHEKGSFTGAIASKKGIVEIAHGGTLLLDELGDMPAEVQADLLRFLQTRRYRRLGGVDTLAADVRIVAAAQPALLHALESGAFRSDLYYRIAEVVLETPCLKQVPDDIIRVARHVAFSLAGQADLQKAIDTNHYFESGLDALRAHAWPGNVRELAALVKRRFLLGDDVLEELRHAPRPREQGAVDFSKILPVRGAGDIVTLDALARDYVRYVFSRDMGLTQDQAARRLGRSVNTIKKLLRGE